MGKALKNQTLFSHFSGLRLLVVTAIATLAAAGCTTDRQLGWGAPETTSPALRVAPTSGITTGSETPALPPPMMSSSGITRDPDRAAAIMSRHALSRTRVLGVVSPGDTVRGYESDIVPLIYASRLNNGQVTVNSTLNSPATPAVVGNGVVTGTTPVVVAPGTFLDAAQVAPVAPVVIGSTTGTPLTLTSGTLTTPLAPAATTMPAVAAASATAPPHTATTSPLVVRSGTIPAANDDQSPIRVRSVNGKVVASNGD